MDYGKVQADAVKDLVKAKVKNHKSDYVICKEIEVNGAKYVPVLYRNTVLYLIPLGLFLLDAEICGEKDAAKFFADADESEPLADTGIMAAHQGAWVREFRAKNGERIYVSDKLLKPFGRDFRCSKQSSGAAVFVIDNTLGLVGLVCAIRMPGNASSKAIEDM